MNATLRRQIEAFLAAYAWTDTIDALIAELHGVAEAEVRAVREARSLRHRIARRAHELARLTGHTGTPGLLVERMLEAALSAAQRPAQVMDQGRSAGRVVSRSRARAEAPEGISGGQGPEMTLTARQRVVRAGGSSGTHRATGRHGHGATG